MIYMKRKLVDLIALMFEGWRKVYARFLRYMWHPMQHGAIVVFIGKTMLTPLNACRFKLMQQLSKSDFPALVL